MNTYLKYYISLDRDWKESPFQTAGLTVYSGGTLPNDYLVGKGQVLAGNRSLGDDKV